MHPENLPSIMQHGWNYILPSTPRISRAVARVSELDSVRASGSAHADRSEYVSDEPDVDLTSRIRAEAARLGLSAIGFTAYDLKYTFAENAGTHDEGTVIVCVYEQDWEATQTAPSARSERAAFEAYAGITERSVALSEFVEGLGHRAFPHSHVGETVAIHYGVQAGLGQLGLNGQLLTPQAGSRARIAVITTNTCLVHDEPVDYGIHTICDECQACVRRCPVGAIPNTRKEHRGVKKAKIKSERCFPLVSYADGCAVCMKVCPIQRYGLEAVQTHYHESGGKILGKDTDQLEGYVWPLDGRFYGASEKPDAASRREALNPPHYKPIDPTLTKPAPDA
jgi:epoxyqueuosine reductase